jgi:hypothetical protein
MQAIGVSPRPDVVSTFGGIAVLKPALPDEVTRYPVHSLHKLRMELSSEHRTPTDDVTGYQ